MKIVHKVNAEGWHSLRVLDDKGNFVIGVGVMLEGTYQTSPHQTAERLHFLKGSATMDGKKCGLKGQKIDTGASPVFIVTKAPAIYVRTE